MYQQKSEVVAFLTHHLERALCSHDADFVVVNSEDSPRALTFHSGARVVDLPSLDLAVSHKGLDKGKRVPYSNTTCKLGVLADWEERESLVAVLNQNVQIDRASFGDVYNYTLHVNSNIWPPPPYILLDKREFWLMQRTLLVEDKDIRMQWSDEGSERVLAEFASSSLAWIELLNTACAMSGVNAVEGSLLGSGGYGHVFRVHRANDPDKELARPNR
jgi:hypothetical protein